MYPGSVTGTVTAVTAAAAAVSGRRERPVGGGVRPSRSCAFPLKSQVSTGHDQTQSDLQRTLSQFTNRSRHVENVLAC